MTDGPRHGQSPTGPAARAADPNTPQVQLQMLAGDHPELRPLIAENPNTYPALLQWLAELGDPAIDAALARRSAGSEEFSAVRADHPQGDDQDYDQGYEQSYDQDHDPRYDPRHDSDRYSGQAAPQARAGYYPAAPTGPAPWETPAAPAVYREPAPEPRRRGGGTCAIILLILLVAAAAVVAAYFLIFNGVFPGNEDPAEETSVSEAPTEQTPEEAAPEADAQPNGTAEDDAEADEGQDVRPAPDGAQDIPAFTAPSGNINCVIGEDELSCSILEYSFEAPQDCDGPARLSVGSADPQLDCGSTGGADSATLQYGQSASSGRFACTSSETAFECWNTETGNGFSLSRESYQLQN